MFLTEFEVVEYSSIVSVLQDTAARVTVVSTAMITVKLLVRSRYHVHRFEYDKEAVDDPVVLYRAVPLARQSPCSPSRVGACKVKVALTYSKVMLGPILFT